VDYFYADDGTLVGKAFNGKRVNYEYDPRGQLLAVTDDDGNDLERYTYDPSGNRLSKTVDGVTTTYTYDEANQLVTSTVNGVATEYRYDAAGLECCTAKHSS
jgi:YD repeat-containing protein